MPRGNQCRIRCLGEIGSGLRFEKNASATLKRLVWSKETNYKAPAKIQAEMMRPQAKMAVGKKRTGRCWDSKYGEPRRNCHQLDWKEGREKRYRRLPRFRPGAWGLSLGRNARGWAGFMCHACGIQKYSAGSDCMSQSWEWRMPDMSSAITGPACLPKETDSPSSPSDRIHQLSPLCSRPHEAALYGL